MKREMFMKYLNSKYTKEKDLEDALEQLKKQNNDFVIEYLLQLKSSNLDQMERILDDAHQLRMVLTDVLHDLNDRDQFFYQICCYINTWNLFNKILEIEDVKQETNKDIKTILADEPAAKEVLQYLYRYPGAEHSGISKALNCEYNLDDVENTLNILYDNDIVYKTSIGNDAIYDLTENARRWVEKNIDTDAAITCTATVMATPLSEWKKTFYDFHVTHLLGTMVPVMAQKTSDHDPEVNNIYIGKINPQSVMKYSFKDDTFSKKDNLYNWKINMKYEMPNKTHREIYKCEEDDTIGQKKLAGLFNYIK